MNCPVCGDKGVVRVRYRDDSTDDFGVCLCGIGQGLRHDRNALGKALNYFLWHIWAAREQVELSRMFMVEELLTDDELAAIPRAEMPAKTSIAEAMNVNKRPRL